MRSIFPLVCLLFTTVCHLGDAKIIDVGGSPDAWKIPESSNNTLCHWAESVRFLVGDILVFSYDAKKDSVLQVAKENYESCNTEKPLKEYKHGNSKVKLDVSGPHFFISGAPTGNCGKGEKLVIVVQSPNHTPTPKPKPAVPPTSSPKSPTSPLTAPAPTPAKNIAVGLLAGNGIFWAFTLVAFIGL